MSRSYRCFMIVISAALWTGGCKNYESASDRQQRQMNQMQDDYGNRFTHMVDNAILRDMSLADFHFIPHSSELSGTGAARLERMAKLLNVYGGTVNYVARETDPTMIKKRLDHVQEYLTLSGCDMDRVTIQVGISGGNGGPAEEAVTAYRASEVGAMRGDSSNGQAAQGALSGLGNSQGNN